ncbi:PilZ domain-containing protein [Lachnospiraceae bacterium 62-35]
MRLKNCESCMVYGTDNHPLSRARVELDGERESRLYFTNPKFRSIRVKTVVDFYDRRQGVIRCRCELVIKRNDGVSRKKEPWMADCKILEIYDAIQRQKDLRVEVKTNIECRSEKGAYFSGMVQNISAGGLFLVSSQTLKKNDIFAFQYRFSAEVSRVRVRVLRVTALMNSEFGYGCQFIGLSPDNEAAIRKFVYAKQMEKVEQTGKRQV